MADAIDWIMEDVRRLVELKRIENEINMASASMMVMLVGTQAMSLNLGEEQLVQLNKLLMEFTETMKNLNGANNDIYE